MTEYLFLSAGYYMDLRHPLDLPTLSVTKTPPTPSLRSSLPQQMVILRISTAARYWGFSSNIGTELIYIQLNRVIGDFSA